jgi:hypothetical protein
VAKGKRTLIADSFEGVLDGIEAFNEKRAELVMEEELLRREKGPNRKKEQGRHGSKKSNKAKTAAPPTVSGVQPALAVALDHDDVQVATTLSGLLEQCGAEWSSTSPPSSDAERWRC